MKIGNDQPDRRGDLFIGVYWWPIFLFIAVVLFLAGRGC